MLQLFQGLDLKSNQIFLNSIVRLVLCRVSYAIVDVVNVGHVSKDIREILQICLRLHSCYLMEGGIENPMDAHSKNVSQGNTHLLARTR